MRLIQYSVYQLLVISHNSLFEKTLSVNKEKSRPFACGNTAWKASAGSRQRELGRNSIARMIQKNFLST